MTRPQIQARNLSKTYRDVEAVRDISFGVGAGEMVGFIGPNGAGKTTTPDWLTNFTIRWGAQSRRLGYDSSPN